MNNEKYEVQVQLNSGNWAVSQECHLVGALDSNGYHKTVASAEDSLKDAKNDGLVRKIVKV